MRLAFILATFALTGCVSSDYFYDLPQDRYNGTGYGYYSTPQSIYYGQPTHYGQPTYYGQSRYLPPVVYYDHDHDRYDCRHVSHRDRRSQDDRDRRDRDRDGQHRRNGRDTDDRPATEPPAERRPRMREVPVRPPARVATTEGAGFSQQAPRGTNPCAGRNKCGASGEASGVPATRDAREPRMSIRGGTETRPGIRSLPE